MKIIGHRGARGLAPENTIESILAGLHADADGIEIDVRVTSDCIIVLSHDPFLVDQAGDKWIIKQHTYDSLLEHFPRLTAFADAVAVVPHGKALRVEIKPNEPVEPIAAFLRPLFAEHPQLSVVSFDFALLKALQQELPQLPLILNEKWSGVRARLRADKLGTKRIQMNQRWLWHGFLKAMKRSGYLVTPYTVNNPAQAAHWEKYIEGIITDYPDRFSN